MILLGASNVTKAISTIIETAQHLLGSPLDVYAAIGHGRSYGIRSNVFVRGLPSVLDSRLWDVIGREQTTIPTYGLIGDIGNDVMYGPSPDTIAGWIETCLDRLQSLRADVVCTSLPIARIERLKQWEYLIARTLLFPSNRLSLEEAMRRARNVVEHVEHLAAARRIPFVELPGEWYGIDPIHIRRSHWAQAWGGILHHWIGKDDPNEDVYRARGSIRRWMKLRTKSPEQWWLLGMERGRSQPCATLDDGTRISLY